ncbi:MAG: DNA-directed RNA polymerase subunit omega [Oligoflexus sp.]
MARVSVEDCLRHIENRFALVAVASHRTRQLMEGKAPLVKTKNKEAVTALREIAEGLIVSNIQTPSRSPGFSTPTGES